MKTKHEKHIDALRRREAQLLSECEKTAVYVAQQHCYQQYRYAHTHDLQFYVNEANNIRAALGLRPLSIKTYPELIVTDGYTQFYPQEEENAILDNQS